ncbi:hypothetical protein Agub_g1306 [Astrephomene gubernaculifera]|uniref:Protein kinase domain-containing protein n=1 Tax=Astrephomene gubernaculifera TaxID=47775 RepID=A0AAD3DIY3_9CHLO|nr:hypothetical protein Agub_g1306 [Astrephomene gubernaculifera]
MSAMEQGEDPMQRLEITKGGALGCGSFAVVYRATWDGFPCALKVLLPQHANLAQPSDAPSSPARMLFREGEALMRHPHRCLARCYAMLELPPDFPGLMRGYVASTPALVLELMQEGSLTSIMHKQMLTPWKFMYDNNTALAWGIQLASALAHLHGSSPAVIHRDVKMDNVMLQRPGAGAGGGGPEGPAAGQEEEEGQGAAKQAGERGGDVGDAEGKRPVAKLVDLGLCVTPVELECCRTQQTLYRTPVPEEGDRRTAHPAATGSSSTPTAAINYISSVAPAYPFAPTAHDSRIRDRISGPPGAMSFSLHSEAGANPAGTQATPLFFACEKGSPALVPVDPFGPGYKDLALPLPVIGTPERLGTQQEEESEAAGGEAGRRGSVDEGRRATTASGGVSPSDCVSLEFQNSLASSRGGAPAAVAAAGTGTGVAAVPMSPGLTTAAAAAGVASAASGGTAVAGTSSGLAAAAGVGAGAGRQESAPWEEVLATARQPQLQTRPRPPSATPLQVRQQQQQEPERLLLPQPQEQQQQQQPPSCVAGRAHAWDTPHDEGLQQQQRHRLNMDLESSLVAAEVAGCSARSGNAVGAAASGGVTQLPVVVAAADCATSGAADTVRECGGTKIGPINGHTQQQQGSPARSTATPVMSCKPTPSPRSPFSGRSSISNEQRSRAAAGPSFSSPGAAHAPAHAPAASLSSNGFVTSATRSAAAHGSNSITGSVAASCGLPHMKFLSEHMEALQSPAAPSAAASSPSKVLPVGDVVEGGVPREPLQSRGPIAVAESLEVAEAATAAARVAEQQADEEEQQLQQQVGAAAPVLPGIAGQREQVWRLTGHTGSFMTMAPEVYMALPYNEKADVFSYGVVLYEIFSRTLLAVSHVGTRRADLPHVLARCEDYTQAVCHGYRPSKLACMPEAVWGIIQDCWHPDPLRRPPMQQVEARLRALAQKGDLNGGQGGDGDGGDGGDGKGGAEATCAECVVC